MKNLYNLLTQCARRTLFLHKTTLLLLATLFISVNAWGAYNRSYYAGVGVGSGKGTAYVEVRWKYALEGQTDKKSTTGSLVSISTSQSKRLKSSLISYKCIYTESPSTGYSFGGWYTTSDCSGSAASTSAEWTAKGWTTDSWSVTYYARFTPNTYYIKFNNNGGSGNMADQTHTYDQEKTLTANSFTKVGYTFNGWNTKADGTGTSYTDKKSVKNLTSENGATINLYAQWKANTYYVQFNGNGNSGGSMSKQTLTYDKSANLTANAFTRAYTITYNTDGGSCDKDSETATYTFGGWAESENGEKKYNNQHSVKNLTSTKGETINLFAIWNDGTITLPKATKAGKVFEGWFIDDEFIGAKNANYDPTANVTLKAHWADITSPRYTWNGEEAYKVGDPALNLNTLWVSNNDEDAKTFTLISFTPSGTNNSGATAPTLTGSTLTLGQAGEVKIKVSQPASDYFYEGEAELTLTINKHENIILIKGEQSYRKEIDIRSSDNNFTFAATNTDYTNYPIQIEQIAGQNVATYYPDQKTVKSGNLSGEAVWQVTQDENYYYASASTIFAIDVRLAAEIVCYLVDDAFTESWGTVSNSKTYSFDRQGKVCTFQARRVPITVLFVDYTNNDYYYAEYSSDGESWTKALKLNLPNTDEWKDFSMNLPANARYVRFATYLGAMGTREVRNVKVSRFTYLNLSDETLTFDKTSTNAPLYCGDAATKTFTIDWSMPQNGTEINITSDNPKFTVSQAKISNTGCNDGSNTITVTYSSDVAGTFNGTITINNEVYYKQIAVTATTIKRDQTISWSQDQNYITTDAITLVATATSELDPTYSVVEGADVATVDETTGVVTILKAGDVKFRASQAGDDFCYNAAQPVDLEFHITRAQGSLTMNDGSTVVSYPDDEIQFDLNELFEASTNENAAISYEVVSDNAANATIQNNIFSAIETGDYTIRATIEQTGFYTAATAEFAVSVNEGITFQGDAQGRWTEENSPSATDRVIVSANVDVVGAVSVASLTINAEKTVTIKNNGALTVGDKNSLSRSTYGNIVIEAGGKLILNEGEVHLNEFTLQSTFESEKPMSGQVINQNKLIMHGDAYFIMDIDPSGETSYGWYKFSVPFPVDELRGITRWENNDWKPLTNEVNYAVMKYHENLRAQGKYGWKKYTGILQPGEGYSITTDTTINRYRFKKADTAAFDTCKTYNLIASEQGIETDLGWNSLGNRTMEYVSLKNAPGAVVQVYDHNTNEYHSEDATLCSFVVGAAYFVQAIENNSSFRLNPAEDNQTMLRAPQRLTEENDECRISLSLMANGHKKDMLVVTCDDQAQATYTRGKDVQKMDATTGAKAARIWVNAKGTNLCAYNTAFSSNDQAIIPLNIYAPTQGEYTLKLNYQPAEEVYLRRNGIIVWNMEMGDYFADFAAGTDNSYDLLVIRHAPNTATGIDAIDSENDKNGTIFVEKIIVNDQLYILRDGTLYDAQGRVVTNR